MKSTSPSSKPTQTPNQPLTKSPKVTKRIYRKVKLMLVGVLMLSISLVSGCVSNSTLPSPNSVNVDSSLMVKPNYTERLVKLLSE